MRRRLAGTIAPAPGTAHGTRVPLAASQTSRIRFVLVAAVLASAFFAVGGQLTVLALRSDPSVTLAASSVLGGSFARPDIVDRSGRLLATDVEMLSLFADPSLVLDRNEVVEKLAGILPGLEEEHLRATLSEKQRRFAWVRRGLSPKVAQQVHDLGLPGLAFRPELKRAYPAGSFAGHLLGTVNIDNRGMSGLERYIDQSIGVERVHGATRADRAPVRLSVDLGVQHAVEDELARTLRRYGASSAAALVLDVDTGEVLGSASLPGVDPGRPAQSLEQSRLDRIAGGTFELGSVFKLITVALAFEGGKVSPQSIVDVTSPIVEGTHTIRDPHSAGRPLTVAEVFTHSSNVGAALLALEAGPEKHADLLARLNLSSLLVTEAGEVAAPQLPKNWERIEQITVAYGHGIAVAPLQFAAAAAALVNGGEYITPTFLKRLPGSPIERRRVVSAETSARLNALLRLNVTDPHGTGRRAETQGYKVGGKTGTAEMAVDGKYKKKSVISSFLAAFPMDRPRYVVLVSLFEPSPTDETRGEIAASVNAAPSAGRLIRRIAPLLGVLPEGALAAAD